MLVKCIKKFYRKFLDGDQHGALESPAQPVSSPRMGTDHFVSKVPFAEKSSDAWKPVSFLKIILLLFNYSCLHFLPTPAKPTSLSWFHPCPWFCPCVLYSSSWKPFSPLSLPSSPLAIVRLFLTTMSLVIFSLFFFFSFVDYVPVKGEIIWYLSLTAWLISLSIMLSSSIHAVAKGISSFFLSAA